MVIQQSDAAVGCCLHGIQQGAVIINDSLEVKGQNKIS